MHRIATGLIVCAGVFAQAQVPPAQTAADSEVIHINVNLVQVDAVVTDSQGRLVKDLKASDFEILQDGKSQNITNFSYVGLRPVIAPASAPKALPKGVPPPPPVPVRPEQARRMIALVVDDLGLSFSSVAYVRTALKKFVEEQMEPGDLVAIIRTGAGMGALQQFTADKRVLNAAIEHVRYNSLGRVGVSSTDVAGEDAGNFDVEREQIFAAGSLGAIRYVVDGLREMPGRKALVLFSENMKLFYADGQSPRVQESLQQLTDAANRSSVVVYTIDPRGLQTLSLTAADNTRGMTAQQISRIPQQRSAQEFSSRDGLVMLAHDTGGTFQYNTNDITGALRKAVNDTEGYYLIGYHPSAATFDAKTGQPKFHNVQVRVKRSGLKVRSRSGFIGRSDALKIAQPRGRQAELAHALTSPFASGTIHLRLTTLYLQAASGPILQTLMHIDANDLKFTDQPDGWHKAVIDVAAVTYGDAGQPVDNVGRTYTVQLKGEEYKVALARGFVYTMQVPLKKPGAYQVRVALRDSDSDQLGSASQFIDVPDANKGKLILSSLELKEYVPPPPAPEGQAVGAPPTTAPPTAGQPSAAPLTAGQTEMPPNPGQSSDGRPAGTAATRTFAPGKEVIYGYQILNAKSEAGQPANLEAYSRLYREGQQIYMGKPLHIETAGQPDQKRMIGGGILKLGTQMQPGDYVLQVIVTDKSTNNTASQWMDFEVR